MDSGRYHRPSSPRGRLLAPGRSSTGTFADPYSYDTYYGRDRTSPRSSAERIGGSQYPGYTSSTSSYVPSSSTSSRSSGLKYDSYSGRPRRSTLTEEDRPTTSKPVPVRAPGVHSHHHHLDRPSSPLARSWDNRGDTYITHGPSQHKRIYSVDDKSHSTKLVAEKELVKPERKDSRDSQGYSVTSGGRPYHTSSSSRHTRTADLGDDGYSYTDAAGMYRDTEPAWRRPRAGSLERSARPTSLIMERAPRTSARELGPPPSTRGFDKINNGIPRTSSVREPARSSSTDIVREIPKYDAYPEAPVHRSSSTRHAPAVHQEPREHRRDTYDPYEARDRDYENRRQGTADSFHDREVTARGFGILPGNPAIAHEQHPLDRQPIWSPQETGRGRVVDDYGAAPYYAPERADARMPDLPRAEPPRAEPPRVEPPRVPRERETERVRDRDRAPTYEERPRERDRRDRDSEDRGLKSGALPAVAGVAAGAAAVTYGAGDILKARERERERERERDTDRDRDRDRDSDRERERDRERRREHDERDRRDRAPEDRRDRAPEDRREIPPEERRDRGPEVARLPPAAAAAFASTQEPERRPRERRYEDDERERKPRRTHSSDGSNDERPRHYVDREVARDADRRKEQSTKEPSLDPDEEYRRRIQLEAERSGRVAREREPSDTDRDRERRRRKEDRDRSRDAPDRARGPSSSIAEPPASRYEDPRRSAPLLNTNVVSEPDSFISPASARDGPSKSVHIVEAPREPPSAPKGILRKPTEKFPEHPESIREGVAPHKDAMKGKDIPVNARWTKIDRSLVNPEALEEAKERYEERMDCVIVLRVLTKQDIQKLADRTKEIRQAREEEFERKERRDRDKRSHRSHRDDEDRDHRRDYDDSEEDDIGGRDREPDWYRQRHREEPLQLEAGR